ncbi:hypothetical protein, partial [Pseudomonas aeruginosa]|uniref:hypothetical protein n=1 Tax=Pseudomonas aeruginosa TaxID=287 RepID=UPI001EDFF40B
IFENFLFYSTACADFRKFSFLLNRLRRPSNHLPISGRRILQRSNSLSSTSVKLRFEPLPGLNRCGEQPA